jgi:integrase
MKNRPHLLDAKTIDAATDDNRIYNDGGALSGCALEIHVRNGGRSKRGNFRYNGLPFGENRTTRKPLGDWHELGLAGLRRKRAACEALIEEDKSPRQHAHEVDRDQKKKPTTNPTVAEAFEEHFAHCMEKRWGKKHRKNWTGSGRTDKPSGIKVLHLDPIIQSPEGHMLLRDIEWPHVLVWLERTRKKRGVNQKLHSFWHGMFERNIYRGIYTKPNPASWKHEHPLYEELSKLPPQGRFEELELDDLPLIVADLMKTIEGNTRQELFSPASAAATWNLDTTAIYFATKKKQFPNLIKLDNKRSLIPYNDLVKTYGEPANEPIHHDRSDAGVCALSLLYQLVTVCRPGMARELKWGQIKWQEQGGYIEYLPTTKTSEAQHKTGHDSNEIYHVILTEKVRWILKCAQEWAEQNNLPMGDNDYVFRHGKSRVGLNKRKGNPLSDAADGQTLTHRLKTIPGLKKRKGTPHSVRYAFPKWAYERRGFDYKLIDLTLGHKIPPIVANESNSSYYQGIRFPKPRRKMMGGWEKFLFSKHQQTKKAAIDNIPQKTTAKIIPLSRRPASA